MKITLKIILSCVILSISHNTTSQTQNDTSNKIKFSPKIGLTIANHKIKSTIDGLDNDRKTILGFLVGIGANKPINEKLSIESGFYIVQKGSKSTEEGEEDFNYSDELRMLYVDVPIFAKYKLDDQEESLTFYGGLQPSYLLNAKLTTIMNDFETSETVTDNYKKFDIAVSIGVGYFFNNRFSIHFHYNYGLIDINKKSDQVENNYFETFNRVIKFSIAYKLGERNNN